MTHLEWLQNTERFETLTEEALVHLLRHSPDETYLHKDSVVAVVYTFSDSDTFTFTFDQIINYKETRRVLDEEEKVLNDLNEKRNLERISNKKAKEALASEESDRIEWARLKEKYGE